MLPHLRIHKYTWTSPDGQTHNEIDHVLIDGRRHSNILYVRSFRGADCDTDHYLVVTNIRERSKYISDKYELIKAFSSVIYVLFHAVKPLLHWT
jgi:hypothetical protein